MTSLLLTRVAASAALLFCLGSTSACDDGGENCIADCDTTPGQTSSTAGESATASDTANSATCAELLETTAAFYEANSSCSSLLDCQGLYASCFPPGVPAACTGISVATSADLQGWDALDAQVVSACGSSCDWQGECVSLSLCNDEQRCIETSGVSADQCEAFVMRDLEAFLAQNSACTEDEDCVGVALCATPGDDSCLPVAMNTAANSDDWGRIAGAVTEGCGGGCVPSEDCEPAARCGESGFCEPVQ